ncbi:MAG: hypothetical protein Kow0080_32180 [Candidatus Promineifilaceae bacterium]
MFSQLDLIELNNLFESASPLEIIKWAWHTFKPKIAVTSSFQTQSVPLLHMISDTVPEMPIFFLDTGFHFAETLAYRDQLNKELNLNVINLKPEMGHDKFQAEYGDLYKRDPDRCCYINKVVPLQKALKGLDAWISGIRRDQTPQRRNIPAVSRMENGLYKICPMVTWTGRDVWQYIAKHELPEHPLLSQGFMSIGCAPCTRPVYMGEDERAGRWAGANKVECGLHTNTWDQSSLTSSRIESEA